ncbi:MAG TPA: stalk domain-containing protein [Chthonomonadaceae bacterium]|nr:stalk domain-containing protein [Chthonomonadaceae bacterium]
MQHAILNGNSYRTLFLARLRSLQAPLYLAIFLLLSGVQALAQDISVTVNGDPVVFNGMGPQQVQGRVLVPVRGVLEKLGASVTWVPETQTVVASNGKVDIQLRLNDRHATVNSKDVLLDVPAQLIAGRTMVPLRFLGEALGLDVKWDGQTRTVLIVSQDQGHEDHDQNPQHRHDHDDNAPKNSITPTINGFAFTTESRSGWLRAGQALTATLDGTPNSDASFRIPGLAEDIPMRETAPGHYVGSWTVPDNQKLQLGNATVIGSLRRGDKIAPLIQAANMLSVDTVPPQIRDRSPEPDTRVTSPRPNISAVFEDHGGSQVNTDRIRLMLNGHDITGDATITKDFVTFTPKEPLQPGPQTVELRVTDNAGNTTESVWKFMQAERAVGGIKTVNHNGDRILEPGDTLHVEMTGSPGGAATFSVGNIKDIRMAEVAPGRYATDYTVRKGDDVENARLAVRLVGSDGEKYVQQADRAVRVRTGKPIDPVISSPGPNDTIANPLIIKGKATPNTQVHVKVDYRNRLLGVVGVQGTAADTVVNVDKNGFWQTDPINLSGLFNSRGVEYTITAISTNAFAEKSGQATLKLKGK